MDNSTNLNECSSCDTNTDMGSNTNTPKLSAASQAVLTERGITVETAIKTGIRAYWTPEEGAELLDRRGGHRSIPAPGLVIPYSGCDGYVKLRPDDPRVLVPEDQVPNSIAAEYMRDPPPQFIEGPKYLCPCGKGSPVYYPFGVDAPLLRSATRIWICESEFKALALRQAGLAAVAVQGVQNGGDGNARWIAKCEGRDVRVLAEGLKRLAVADKTFIICFDSDVDTNGNVLAGLHQLGVLLAEENATVEVAYLPHEKGKGTLGIDDYLAVSSLELECRLELLQDSVRPFNVAEALGWLEEHWDDMDREQQNLERGRVMKLAGLLLKRHDFNRWQREAKKRLGGIDEAEIANLAPPAEVLTAETAYTNFGTAKLVEHCVPVLNKRFALLRAEDGTERIFSVNARREVNLLHGDAHLRQVLHDHLKALFGQIPPDKLLGDAILLWKKECPRLVAEPEPFCFEGDQRLCFKCFDWQPTQAPCPAWSEFLERLSDRETFMAYVWSCFEPKNMGRQYLWLRGEGQDGKSVVLGVLMEVFGPAATGITNSHLKGNQFVYSAFYGKRLAVYADCKNPRFGMMEIVRNLTSGDHVLVEYKGQTPFSHPLKTKLFVASNPKPEISSQNSDRSRMLYIEIAESKRKDDPTWRSRLMGELPGFLWMCRLIYQRLCPHHGDLPLTDTTRALQDERAASFEQKFQDFFDENFVFAQGAKLTASIVSKRARAEHLSDNEISDFKQWMERTHGINYRRTNCERYYENLAEARKELPLPPEAFPQVLVGPVRG